MPTLTAPNRLITNWLTEQSEIIPIEKSADGKVTINDIQGTLREYAGLFKAGYASPAMILTLHRAYPDSALYKEVVEQRGLLKEDPMVVGGPASVEMIDHEGHLITAAALSKAYDKYMENPMTRNVMVMHSDIQVGWALPAYISRSGEVFKGGMNDKTLFFISELRKDTKISKKVTEQIIKSKMRSYSIAGSAIKTENVPGNIIKGESPYMRVDELELAEVTICLVENVPVWTKSGLKKIKDIVVGEKVLTHNNRWRKVLNTMVNEVDEDIFRITTTDGKTVEGITGNHPVRKLVHGGQGVGTRYEWVEASDIKVGDTVQAHYSTGVCDYCNAPLFKRIRNSEDRSFCDQKCRKAAPGNALGRRYDSTLKGITKAENINLTGGIRTPEGRAKQIAATKTPEFSAMRSDTMKKQMTSERASDMAKTQWENRSEGEKASHMGKMVKAARYKRSANRMTRPEVKMLDILKNLGSGWEFIGDFSKTIGGKNPDFLNDNKIIEVYGDYWHRNDNPQDRIDFFNRHGYETLVVWESELNNNHDEVVERVAEFAGNALTKVDSIETFRHTGKVYNIEVEEDNSYVTEAFTVHNCEKGVNQGAGFDLIKSHNHATKSCADGSCLITKSPDVKPLQTTETLTFADYKDLLNNDNKDTKSFVQMFKEYVDMNINKSDGEPKWNPWKPGQKVEMKWNKTKKSSPKPHQVESDPISGQDDKEFQQKEFVMNDADRQAIWETLGASEEVMEKGLRSAAKKMKAKYNKFEQRQERRSKKELVDRMRDPERRESRSNNEDSGNATERARTGRAGTKAYNANVAGKTAASWKPWNSRKVASEGGSKVEAAEQQQMRGNKNTSSRRAADEKKATLKTDYEKYTGKNANDRIKEKGEQRLAENKKAYDTKMGGATSPSASNSTAPPSRDWGVQGRAAGKTSAPTATTKVSNPYGGESKVEKAVWEAFEEAGFDIEKAKRTKEQQAAGLKATTGDWDSRMEESWDDSSIAGHGPVMDDAAHKNRDRQIARNNQESNLRGGVSKVSPKEKLKATRDYEKKKKEFEASTQAELPW